MKTDGFRIFIGVDQTGAVLGKGLRAKPLPCAVLLPRKTQKSNSSTKAQLQLHLTDQNGARLSLADFSPASLQLVLTKATGASQQLSGTTALIVDSVFGLAESAWPKAVESGSKGLWTLFRNAARDEKDRAGYGLNAAATYFAKLLPASNPTTKHVRRCEVASGANSVFQTRPYQKNIQCGTYRIWRDLGRSESEWVSIWNFETRNTLGAGKRPWLIEGYPSLFWREVFGFKTRKPPELAKAIAKVSEGRIAVSKRDQEVIANYPDWADAAALAVGTWVLQNRGLLNEKRRPENWRRFEGWILGLVHSKQLRLK